MFDNLYFIQRGRPRADGKPITSNRLGLPKKNAIKTTGTIRKLSETNNLPDQLAKNARPVDPVQTEHLARDTQIEGLLGQRPQIEVGFQVVSLPPLS